MNNDPELVHTLEMLKVNTCGQLDVHWDKCCRLRKIHQATGILEDGKFTIHKWESNVEKLESENMGNPSKILGHIWNKREDTLQVPMNKIEEGKPVTKNTILSQLARVYDPLGIISPTLVEGKRIFWDACDEQKGWDVEVSKLLVREIISDG